MKVELKIRNFMNIHRADIEICHLMVANGTEESDGMAESARWLFFWLLRELGEQQQLFSGGAITLGGRHKNSPLYRDCRNPILWAELVREGMTAFELEMEFDIMGAPFLFRFRVENLGPTDENLPVQCRVIEALFPYSPSEGKWYYVREPSHVAELLACISSGNRFVPGCQTQISDLVVRHLVSGYPSGRVPYRMDIQSEQEGKGPVVTIGGYVGRNGGHSDGELILLPFNRVLLPEEVVEHLKLEKGHVQIFVVDGEPFGSEFVPVTLVADYTMNLHFRTL